MPSLGARVTLIQLSLRGLRKGLGLRAFYRMNFSKGVDSLLIRGNYDSISKK